MPEQFERRTIRTELPAAVVQRLEQAAQDTGLDLNTLVTIACLDWLRRHDTQWSALHGASPPRPPEISE